MWWVLEGIWWFGSGCSSVFLVDLLAMYRILALD
jgi:hypothetical protein